MKKAVAVILFFCAFSALAQSTAGTAESLIYSSAVKFKIKNAGFNVEGKFGNVSGKILFDKNKNYGNSIDVSLEAKSINTGNNTRDGHLRKSEYFDAAKFPLISMYAGTFLKISEGQYKGFFKLTVKDKTKEVAIPFTYTEKDGIGTFSAEFTLNRLDFGVGSSSMIMSNEVRLFIEVKVTKK